MNHRECNQLDAYLLELLEPDERAAFAEHLVGCPTCAREIEVQRRLDGLLAQVGQVDAVPALGLRFDQRLRVRRRRVWLGVGALAASMVLAAGWLLGPKALSPNTLSVATNAVPLQPPLTGRPKVSVRLGDNVIGLPIETSDPRVTIVWTYPVLAGGDVQ
jgi:anti-sigma factor RsiW